MNVWLNSDVVPDMPDGVLLMVPVGYRRVLHDWEDELARIDALGDPRYRVMRFALLSPADHDSPSSEESPVGI